MLHWPTKAPLIGRALRVSANHTALRTSNQRVARFSMIQRAKNLL